MLGFAVSGSLGRRGHQQAPPTGQTISAPTVTRRTARVELTRSQLVQERSLLARPTLSSYGNFLARSARTGPTSGTRASGRGRTTAERTANVSKGRIAPLPGSPQEGPECAPERSFRYEREIGFTARSGQPNATGSDAGNGNKCLSYRLCWVRTMVARYFPAVAIPSESSTYVLRRPARNGSCR